MEAECRVSAELRAELQKAKEEIHTLRETLRLYQPLSGSAAESPHGATQLSEVRANSWAESEKADRLTQSGSLEAESADTAAKGSYVKAEGKVYWVSYEDPEQLIRLPARHSSEKSARLSASEARPDAEPSRRLSGHEKFLPGTPEDHLPRPMRPASLDPHRPCTAYFAGAGTGGRAPIYVQPVMPMSARRTLPPQHQRPMVMGVHGLPRQASSGHFLPATLRHQFSTGSLSSVQSTHRLVQANSLSDLHGHSGHVQTQFAGRFQPVQPAQFLPSRTPRKEGSVQPLYYVAPQPAPVPAPPAPAPPAPAPPAPAQPQKAAGIAAGIAASTRPKTMRHQQDELMNLQSHLKRLQGLQAQLEQQLSDVQ